MQLDRTRRIDGKVRHEIVASLGSVPASPSVADRIAFWRRVYETVVELANRIDAETQGKRPTTAEDFRTILVHLLHHTPFRLGLTRIGGHLTPMRVIERREH